MKLDGKIAVVTGGTAGIGFGIAEAFVKEGATVVISGRREDKGAEAVAALGDNAHFVKSDIKDQAQVDSLINDTVAKFGRIDILVNNAGGANGLGALTHAQSNEVWDDTILWNLTSLFWATRTALGHMMGQKSGRIINISSVEGKNGKPVVTPYTVAKHGVNGFTKAVAREYGEMGITINSICPGIIETEIVQTSGPITAAGMGLTYEGLIELFCAESSIKRPNTVEEVAAVAVLLASDVAAGITGATFSVDGGTAQY